jgi:hypothetical protein
MVYCTESKVYNVSGLSSSKIQTVLGLTEAQVTTLITEHISWAESQIKEWLRSPIIVRGEEHFGDGEKYVFSLGPEDEVYSIHYDVANNVEKVFAIYLNNKRMKLPYPKDDCDLGCENESSSWSSSNCTLSNEATIVYNQSYSLKGIFSTAGYMRYPSGENLDKNINIHEWVAFKFRTNDSSRTFTIKLYDRSGNYNYYSFTVYKSNVEYTIMIKLDDFVKNVDWNSENLYYLDLYSDGECTVYLDNLNFNDGVMWNIPTGEIIVMVENKPTYTTKGGVLPDGYPVKVTYSFDPFKTTVPSYIEEACACLAGAKTFDLLLGRRVQTTGFVLQAKDGSAVTDKYTMSIIRKTLVDRAKDLVGLYGFGFDSGVA